MKMKKLKLYSIAFAFIFQYGLLSAQSLLMNCGNSLEDVVNSKHLTEGENEICSLSEGKINLVAIVNNGTIVSLKALDEKGKNLPFINEVINMERIKNKFKFSSSPQKPYSNLVCTVVDIICGTDASGNLKFCKHKICFPCN